MVRKADRRKKAGKDLGNRKFINDIETTSKALYEDRKPLGLANSKPIVSKKNPKDAKNNAKDSFGKDKKPPLLSWKRLKSLTLVRNRRFNCCFTLLVHSIEGLPDLFNDLCLIVHWRSRDGEQTTCPIRVYQGVAEFEEKLSHSCSINGSRNGSHNLAKYEAKHFVLYASVYDAPELDLGRHRVDLTRLLPVTLEELEREKSSGNWTTSFKLSGRASGATLNVSFGFFVIRNNGIQPPAKNNFSEILSMRHNSVKAEKLLGQLDQMDELGFHRVGGLPHKLCNLNQSPEQYIKDLHEVLPTSSSVLLHNAICEELDRAISSAKDEKNKSDADCISSPVDPHKLNSFALPDTGEKVCETEWEISEYSVTETGIEEVTKEQVKSEQDPHKPNSFTPPDVAEEVCETEWEISKFSVIEKRIIEEVTKEQVKSEEDPTKLDQASGEVRQTDGAVKVPLNKDATLHPTAEEIVSEEEELLVSTCNSKEKEDDVLTKQTIIKERDSDLVNEGLDSQNDETDALHEENSSYINSNYQGFSGGKSLSLDDITDSVANDFLDMLAIEHSPFSLSAENELESPREVLLRLFEEDIRANGGLFNFGIDNDPTEFVSSVATESVWGTICNDVSLPSTFEGLRDKMPEEDTDSFGTKIRASSLALETKALTFEWGLNEKAFKHSLPSRSSGSGNPADMHIEDLQQLPCLAEGLAPFVPTRNGGFLRSMNPVLFRNAKSGFSLIMQVSNHVVMPAKMGSCVMEILQGLAVMGIEKLSLLANKLMPLEDITGKTIQQIAWEAAPNLERPERQGLLQQEREIMLRECTNAKGTSYGPRCGKFDSTFLGTDTDHVSLEDLAPLTMDKIEALSIEGLRIQSGMSDEDAPSNISTQSIGKFSALKRKTLDVSGKYGLLGGNVVTLMVQLRDPLCTYGPVGTSVLALIQVERAFILPKSKFYGTVPPVRDSDEEEDKVIENRKEDEVHEDERLTPKYKITEVHVAGLKMKPGKKKLWGSKKQQKSGSRWLLANGMGKKDKHPLMKSKAVSPRTTATEQPGDTAWSVSSPDNGTGAKREELAARNPHTRNPNVMFPNETIKLSRIERRLRLPFFGWF